MIQILGSVGWINPPKIIVFNAEVETRCEYLSVLQRILVENRPGVVIVRSFKERFGFLGVRMGKLTTKITPL